MPTPTYTLIEEKVLGTNTASVTFSSIPGTYKDLVLEMVGTATSGTSSYPRMQFNSDTGTNYSATFLYGSGTAAASFRGGNVAYIGLGMTLSATEQRNIIWQIQSYANTNVNKTVLIRENGASAQVFADVALWRSTAAITSIVLTLEANSYASGFVFRLWGIAG